MADTGGEAMLVDRFIDQKNLKMEKVALLVVEAEITRDNHNYTLLPVFKDVAHLRKVFHHPYPST